MDGFRCSYVASPRDRGFNVLRLDGHPMQWGGPSGNDGLLEIVLAGSVGCMIADAYHVACHSAGINNLVSLYTSGF